MAASGYTQAGRALRIETPLGTDALLLRSVSGQETISQLFRFQLELMSEDDSISFDAIVGKNVTLYIQTIDSERSLNGFISRFSQGGQDERFTYYSAEMVPWPWFLTRTADCRIFQNMAAPAIIKQIFDDLGFTDYSLRLYGSFASREYCVQYRETDFNFVSRLMEEEGICYFFEHEGSKHTLVLTNDAAGHPPCPGQPKARCDFSPGNWHPDDVVTEWRAEEEYRPNAWSHTDYNFETPSTNLMATIKNDGKFEIYDYPGLYKLKAVGDHLAKTRLQETASFKDRATGGSNCRCFTSGYTVELLDHYRKDMNQKWLLTSVHHQCSMGGSYETGSASDGFFYRNSFEAVPAAIPFRPPRLTPKPSVQGCQTAVVVGPAGEEIFPDKYGRVKVQFFWDREGKKDENSSCWIRVSYPWAGKAWGAIHIPRIGQEVIVDFLEGDPDQPIIVGRVYNAEQVVPWSLPGKKNISGVKSDSTLGGGGYNEISMDDTKGTELINIHAQYDQHKRIEHDEAVSVGHDRTEEVLNNETITVHGNRIEVVDKDETITIHGNRTETVDKDQFITIHQNHTETVDKSMTITVGNSLTEMVEINYSETVGAAMELTIGAALAVTVGAAMAETVGGTKAESVGVSRSVNVGQNNTLNIGKDLVERVAHDRVVDITNDLKETIGGQHQETVTKEYTLHAKKIDIVADDEISIKTGDAQIVLKKSGDINISGGKIMIKGSGDIVMKGSSIKEN